LPTATATEWLALTDTPTAQQIADATSEAAAATADRQFATATREAVAPSDPLTVPPDPACQDVPIQRGRNTLFCLHQYPAPDTSNSGSSTPSVQILTPDDAHFVAVFDSIRGIVLQAQSEHLTGWTLDPLRGQTLAVGTYAVGSVSITDLPQLNFEQPCQLGHGRVQILELVPAADGKRIAHLAANFVLTCDDSYFGSYAGTVLYDATILPSGTLFPTPDPSIPPTATAVPVPPQVSRACLGTEGVAYPVNLLCVQYPAQNGTPTPLQWVTPDNRQIFTDIVQTNQVRLNIEGADRWSIQLAPPGGQQLQPGVYDQALSNRSPVRPYLVVPFQSYYQPSCIDRSGRFEVLQVAFDPTHQHVTQLAVNFEVHCPGLDEPLLGTLLYNATLDPQGHPIPTPDAAHPPPATATASATVTPTDTPVPTAPQASASCLQNPALAGQDTFVCVENVQKGETRIWTPADTKFHVIGVPQTGIRIVLDAPRSGIPEFQYKPALGGPVQVGVYEGRSKAGSDPAGRMFLEVPSPLNAFCQERLSRIDILEVVGTPEHGFTQFAANFEQHCSAPPETLRGVVRYHSTIGR
jgi:hypothetical protein